MSPFELWPSEYSGVLPIKRMLDAGHTGLFWAAHFMTDAMDAGPPIAFSRWMPINAEMSLAQNHEGHAPEIAKFVSDVTQVLTGVSEPADVAPPIGYADFGQLRNRAEVQILNPILRKSHERKPSNSLTNSSRDPEFSNLRNNEPPKRLR